MLYLICLIIWGKGGYLSDCFSVGTINFQECSASICSTLRNSHITVTFHSLAALDWTNKIGGPLLWDFKPNQHGILFWNVHLHFRNRSAEYVSEDILGEKISQAIYSCRGVSRDIVPARPTWRSKISTLCEWGAKHSDRLTECTAQLLT